jgi:hypothetical protein
MTNCATLVKDTLQEVNVIKLPGKVLHWEYNPTIPVLTSFCQVKKRAPMVVDKDAKELFSDKGILCLRRRRK